MALRYLVAMLARIGRSLAAYHHRTISIPRVERIAGVLSEQIGEAASLLDVGCGDGRLGAAVGRSVGAAELRGIDVGLPLTTRIEASHYDGTELPFADRQFEVVLLGDVLHHAAAPAELLAECLRVAARTVALKDHLRFGPLSSAVLRAMDHVGNAASGVTVRGRYLSLPEWLELFSSAGAEVISLRWPVVVHDLPWRLVTRSAYQFTALLAPPASQGRPSAAPTSPPPQEAG